MNISQNALSLIKEFEGLMLRAYIDPVGIPTIGYGTIKYPDGRRVDLSDTISEAEAEAFLKFECDHFSNDVTNATRGIPLNQNQFDALVSFCYNLGLGALLSSTLLKRLKDRDFLGAAAEFPRWNKGTVDGVKQELPGLTRRRAKERELFEARGAGGAPTEPVLSEQEKVTSIKGFRPDDVDLVVAFDAGGHVVEILKLENSLPDTLRAVIGLYPNLRAFNFAKAGEALPPGNPVKFSGLGRPIVKVSGAPILNRQLLVIGAEDDEGPGGDDVRELQTRLRELGYYAGKLDGMFGRLTDDAVKQFQAAYFGVGEADGKVGPLTWGKLWGDATPNKPDDGTPSPGNHYLKLTKTDLREPFGCVKLILAHYKDGQFADSIDVCSGQGRKQTFRPGASSPSGSMEPLPEGKWSLHNIEWADGKDNYVGAVWNNGLGPAKIRLDYLDPGRTPRSAIEIHIDWNRAGAPGTAGCVGVQNVADFKKLVGWLRQTDPKLLFVDWGLGTCPTP